jgi:hypothetical protein
MVITDPCYLMREDGKLSDWDDCSYGACMERLGFHVGNYRVEPTGLGDGSWKVKDSSGRKLGEVSADSGLTGVFLMDEVLKYNPDVRKMKYFDVLATVIEDFDGEIEFSRYRRKYGEPLVIKGVGTVKGRLTEFTIDYGAD